MTALIIMLYVQCHIFIYFSNHTICNVYTLNYKFMLTTRCFVECLFPYHLNSMDLGLSFFLVMPCLCQVSKGLPYNGCLGTHVAW